MKPTPRSPRPAAFGRKPAACLRPDAGSAVGRRGPGAPPGQAGLSLLQGLAVLAIIGVLATVILHQLR